MAIQKRVVDYKTSSTPTADSAQSLIRQSRSAVQISLTSRVFDPSQFDAGEPVDVASRSTWRSSLQSLACDLERPNMAVRCGRAVVMNSGAANVLGRQPICTLWRDLAPMKGRRVQNTMRLASEIQSLDWTATVLADGAEKLRCLV